MMKNTWESAHCKTATKVIVIGIFYAFFTEENIHMEGVYSTEHFLSDGISRIQISKSPFPYCFVHLDEVDSMVDYLVHCIITKKCILYCFGFFCNYFVDITS